MKSSSHYDPFFSRSMEHPPIARSFFCQSLPDKLQPWVGWGKLRRQDRKNTDRKLRQRQQDIVYEAPMGEQGTLLACAEHQSKAQNILLTRIMQYGAGKLEEYTQRAQPWPVIVNFVLYHGQKTPYPYPITPEDCYASPELAMEYLCIRVVLIDLNTLSDQELLRHGQCAPMQLLLKHGRDGNFELPAEAYREVFVSCLAEVGQQYFYTMLDYALSLSNADAGQQIFHFLQEILTDQKKAAMTYGQVLENRGMQKGMQKGIEEERFSLARNMLRDQAPQEQVLRWTGLSKQQLAQLLQS